MLGSEIYKLPTKLRVHIGCINTEWHDHYLDGAMQGLSTASSSICITVLSHCEATVKKLCVLGTQPRQRKLWGDETSLALSVLEACQPPDSP